MKRYAKLALFLLVYTIISYTLIDYDNFPLSPNYRFPLEAVAAAFAAGLVLVWPLEYYFQRIFKKEKRPRVAIVSFLRAAALCVAIIFVAFFVIMTYNQWNLYYFIVSLFLTLLNAIAWIGLVYGKRILMKWTKLDGTDSINIKSGTTIRKVNFSDLAYFSSVNKVVIAHLKSGKDLVTNFNLTELEDLLPPDFFRISRQYILSKDIIQEVRSAENQKIAVQIPTDQLTVSRYRAADFRKWFN